MIIVGDWCPLNKIGNINLKDELILANLEAPILPLTHHLQPIAKAGPALSSHNLPDRKQPIIFSVANNHIMDYGEAGLQATLSTIQANNYYSVGAGKNKYDARRPIIVKENNRRIGIIACCEAQFGIAQEKKAGVAEMGAWIYETIQSLKQETDIIILSVHRAIEDAPWPSPNLQEIYRSFIDAGVSIIQGHHTHVPQGIEEYNNGLILYGLGNFLVNPEKWQHFPNALWSIGIEINFDSLPINYNLLTFEIEEFESNKVHVRESNLGENQAHLRYINNCNFPLTDSFLLTGLWQEIALRTYFHYKADYLNFPHNKTIQLNKKQRINEIKNGIKQMINGIIGKKNNWKVNQKEYLLWYHLFACDSHRESVATALGIVSGEIEDLRTEETCRLADEMMPWSIGVVPL